MGNRSKFYLRLSIPASLFLIAFCFSPSGFRAQDQQTSNSMIESGKRVFSGSCGMSYCHGADAVGGGGPKLRDREFSAEFLTRIVNDGIPGTGMPSFKDNLKKEQIAQVVAFLLSVNKEVEGKPANSQVDPHLAGTASKAQIAEATPNTGRESEAINTTLTAIGVPPITGQANAGLELFFDAGQLQNCRICHTVSARGGKVASDLSRLGGLSPREIFLRILSPQAAFDGKHGMVAITLRSGERFTGISRDEGETSLRIYDTSSLPPVSRNFLKSEIAKTEKLSVSGCPGNYAAKYTLKQLLDLVAFLKTTDPEKPVSVTLKEIFF